MSEEVLVATPLPGLTQPRTFAGGISIDRVSPILWGSTLTSCIADADRSRLDQTRHWLCSSRDAKEMSTDGDHLYETVRRAMYAHQIIHPSGCQNIYLAFHRKPEGYDFIGLCRPQQMNSTLVGRMTSAERRGLAVNFDVVHAGVSHAFSQKVVRLQNPILLLEQGLQTGNPTLAMLMFVMGLDVLFMAGDKVSFVTRAAGFLGLNSYVFPQVLSFDFQPLITVGEVAADLYDLRNLIAHGQEIPKHPFRQEYDVTRITGPGVAHLPCSYVDVLMEAGLFMLTGSLAKIFKDGLYADVGNATKWRATMNRSEHRFKDSGGVLDSSRRSTRWQGG